MFTATKDLILPTTVTGSWPRPSWYTGNLLERPYSSGLADVQFREQHMDAVASVISDQELAGLDILTNGDYHLDFDLAGRSWFCIDRAPERDLGVRHRDDGRLGVPDRDVVGVLAEPGRGDLADLEALLHQQAGDLAEDLEAIEREAATATAAMEFHGTARRGR